jgi:hypothetical protein
MDPSSIVRLFTGFYLLAPILALLLGLQGMFFPSEYDIFYALGFIWLIKTFAEDVWGAYTDVMMFPFRFLKGFFPESWDKPIGDSPVNDDEIPDFLYDDIEPPQTEKQKQDELEKLSNMSPSMKKDYLLKKEIKKEHYKKLFKSFDFKKKY